jgi:pyruvate dehydrogenase E2 component (dihydrolipoamide acetyltransferase)
MAQIIEVKVPDIGNFKDVPVIEVQVSAGSVVAAEDSLITLESDKATFDVPSPAAGTVKEIRIKAGDKVSEGSVVVVLETGPAPAAAATVEAARPAAAVNRPGPDNAPAAVATAAAAPVTDTRPKDVAPRPVHMPSPAETVAELRGGHMPHASPVIRQFARELGVDLNRVSGSGPHGRITREDVQAFVKKVMTATPPAPAPTGGGLNLLPWPKVDFAAIGPVEIKPLSRIKKISGANLARNWAMIPHVTQFDEADITDLEAFRVQLNQENPDFKLTLLAFLIKASVSALKQYPDFNASLDGDTLVLKQYYHIGFAADTPNGLMVPVVRDVDRKSVPEIARETAALAAKAREGKLGMADMQGGCFTLSSLGGIGGTAFTPIINAPEVAILGISRSETRPRWNGEAFLPRLMLPLSLSYDHRVIDGAAAARFTRFLAEALKDMRSSLP